MATDLDNAGIEKAYARWAPIYDLVFDTVMATGRREGVAAAESCGTRILDVGAGTGLEFECFSPRSEVTAVDLSEAMLRRAQMRVRDRRLGAIRGIMVMDATRLAFPDETFDAVLLPYVLTTVPDPEATLDEALRVVRPGGEIVLVNHVGAETGPLAKIEGWLARRTRDIGWRPEFPWARIGDWIESRPSAHLLERRALSPMGLFTLVRIARRAATEGERRPVV
jgi:phosphatidylethanolamine/phosphatidyl-N-methylethanolamine N-methyltransferase